MPNGLNLDKIAEMLGGEIKGNGDYVVNTLSSLEKPIAGSICPLWEKKFLPLVKEGTVLLTKHGWIQEGGHGIEVEDPRRALITLLEYFDPSNHKYPPTIHRKSVISENASIGINVSIGPGCVVSEGASVGDNCELVGNVWVGSNVTVGPGSRIEPGVVLYDRVSIGTNCIIHANAVIGCDGFGFMPDKEAGLLRIPQIGTVIIGDNVEIGVCTSIDRATFGETIVSKGTKIDSHVKIGHNCRIGESCIVIAQSGIAGSSTLGNGVIMAAQSGVSNHANIGDGATAAGRAGVCTDIPAGCTVSGFPARDHRQELRQTVAVKQLPDLLKKFKELDARIGKLELKP